MKSVKGALPVCSNRKKSIKGKAGVGAVLSRNPDPLAIDTSDGGKQATTALAGKKPLAGSNRLGMTPVSGARNFLLGSHATNT